MLEPLNEVRAPPGLYELKTDSMLGDLVLKGFREAFDCKFRGVISGQERKREKTSHGRDIHDDAAAGLAHERQDHLSHADHTQNICVELVCRVLGRYAFERAQQRKTFIIDEHIDSAEPPREAPVMSTV